REGAEAAVADLEADVGDGHVGGQEQVARGRQPHRREELKRRNAGQPVEDAIEVELAHRRDLGQLAQRQRLRQAFAHGADGTRHALVPQRDRRRSGDLSLQQRYWSQESLPKVAPRPTYSYARSASRSGPGPGPATGP